MPQKKKKLSLEEARALFSDKTEPKKRRSNYPKKKSNYSNKKSYSIDKGMTRKRIEQLERKVMEGNLVEKEEQKILNEIEKLEKQIQ
jgi:uncharacterized coiled-coil DUF342 family protein